VSAPPTFAKSAPTPTLLDSAALAVPNRYAASAAQQVLQQGGNAVDAAVAAGFALAVTSPATAGLGGGGFMTLYVRNQPYFLDFRERAPQGAVAGMYLDAKGKRIPSASEVGGRAVAVPGSVAGLWEAHKRFGKLKWAQVLAPAIQLARDGFDVDTALAQRAAAAAPRFKGKTNFSTYFANLHDGARLRQPELAATLQQLADDGGNTFYSGHTADLLADAMRGHGLVTQSDLSDYHAQWRAPLVAPWHGYQVITAAPPSVGGIALVQMLRLREALQSSFDGVGPDTPSYARLTSAIVKRVYADQQGYPGDPDRPTSGGDSGGDRASTAAHWIDASYVKRQAAEIAGTEKAERAKEAAASAAAQAAASEAAAAQAAAAQAAAASSALAASGAANASAASSAAAPEAVSGAAARPASAAFAASASVASSAIKAAPAPAPASASTPSATPTVAPSQATAQKAPSSAVAPKPVDEAARALSTQYAVVDKWGNAVSVSLTMDAPFGAGVVVPGAGFLLNDAMDTFTSPSATGSDAADAHSDGVAADADVRQRNAIAAGRRPVSPMAPTILIDGGKVVLVLGAGSAGRPNSLEGPLTQYRVISSVVYDGRSVGEAVSLPSTGADAQAVQVQGNSPVPQADPHGRGVAAVVK
jgi:gamma-glutamyltranspeptidase/glutathione hydrolase